MAATRILKQTFGKNPLLVIGAARAIPRKSPALRLLSTQVVKQPPPAQNNEVLYQAFVKWDKTDFVTDWFESRKAMIDDLKKKFRQDGFVQVDGLLDAQELSVYEQVCDQLMSGKIGASLHRHDLGAHQDRVNEKSENILQIMWPSEYVQYLIEGPLHLRAQRIAQTLLGPDVVMDFDMVIAKAAHTGTPTPWHQDEAYWLSTIPDKRAVSCWVAIDDSTVENGAMWFGPGSHKKHLLPHRPAKEGSHVLMTEYSEREGIACPLKKGSATFHDGKTLHYSRGNTTDKDRRAYIVNFRPETMVQQFREQGFDHGKKGWEQFDHTVAGDVYKNTPKTSIKK